jgi:hypothetical protein
MKFSLFYLLLCFSFAFFSQRSQGEGVVLGKLVDQKTKNAIEYAKVKVLKAKDSSVLGGQFTDSEGKFNLEGLPFLPMIVQITFAGYDTLWFNDVLPTKELRLVNLGELVMLVNNQRVVDEVVVQGKQDILRSGIDKKVYNVGQDLARRNRQRRTQKFAFHRFGPRR